MPLYERAFPLYVVIFPGHTEKLLPRGFEEKVRAFIGRVVTSSSHPAQPLRAPAQPASSHPAQPPRVSAPGLERPSDIIARPSDAIGRPSSHIGRRSGSIGEWGAAPSATPPSGCGCIKFFIPGFAFTGAFSMFEWITGNVSSAWSSTNLASQPWMKYVASRPHII